MNISKMTPDEREQLLTAYALNELDAAACKKVEAELLNDKTNARDVEQIRALESQLNAELQVELGDGLEPANLAAIRRAMKTPTPKLTSFLSGLGITAAMAVCVIVALNIPAVRKHFAPSRQLAQQEKPEENAATYATSPTPPPPAGGAPQPSDALVAQGSAEMPSSPAMMMEDQGEARMSAKAIRYMPEPCPPPFYPSYNETYEGTMEGGFLEPLKEPLSTFSIDVDTASYANVRRFLNEGQLPPPDAVRIEELINYFTYNYPQPTGSEPFSVNIDMATCPWNSAHLLARIGLKGREVSVANRPAANLVFLLDVSGSMGEPNKLPLVKESMSMLVRKLKPEDRVAIVTYAGESKIALPSTPVSDRQKILDAIDALQSGGSTNGSAGIDQAYEIAEKNFMKNGVNRVILATDGDFNVGTVSPDALVRLVKKKAENNVFLSVFGFGMGNLQDATLEQLADNGNGTYGYIDSRQEARKAFVEQLNGTLVTIAKDVKIQVEFNPSVVSSYRLVGYENRMLQAQDFNNDKKDAGDIGAGHTVTALYEIVTVNSSDAQIDDLKYQKPDPEAKKEGKILTNKDELMTVKLRYKQPDGQTSQKIERPVLAGLNKEFDKASDDFRFAAAVAAFGMALNISEYLNGSTYSDVLEWAKKSIGNDAEGYRQEFVDLVKRARDLMENGEHHIQEPPIVE
ncbi:MAG: VWA domain-containing protein [bacterium]